MTLDPEKARQMAQRSAEVRRGLTPERIAEELPPLDTLEHIREAYQVVQRWAAAGLVPGSIANALVRSCDGATKLLEARIDVGLISKLERRVRELEGELAAARKAAK